MKLLTLLPLLPLFAVAAEVVPLEVKGLQLGQATPADVAKRFPGAIATSSMAIVEVTSVMRAKCGITSGISSECGRQVFEDLVFGGGTLASYYFALRDGTVESVTARFHRNGYDTVRDSLTTKYGQPTSRSIDSVQAAIGATLSREQVIWEHQNGRIVLLERSSKIDESTATLSTSKYLQATVDDQKRRATEGASKL
jgi:hypothetical protein